MKKPNFTDYTISFIVIILCITAGTTSSLAQIRNFDSKGRQVIRFSATGDAVDAHDGEIAHFKDTYYLYGTSYDCGFQWKNKEAPFCGFKVYSSKDLLSWTDCGYLFDAKTPLWQSRCDGKTYGCFRPHVIYNQKSKLYVLWINVYDNRVGYRVFTAKSPVGPFTETAEPVLAINREMPVAGLNNGDHDTFVDDDGTAWLAYTDWRTNGTIVIEKLSSDYLTGTGEHEKAVTKGATEAPGLFKRNGLYYVTYSDPNCGYCSGTGTSYRTAKSLPGPWSEAIKISDNSCGGQPSFVSTIKVNSETVYLYGSDLWNNSAKNEALANYYWAPLTFAADGSINPLNCLETYRLPKVAGQVMKSKVDASTENSDFSTRCDISDKLQRSQSFTVETGILTKVEVVVFKNNNPDKDLVIAVYRTDGNRMPTGEALYTQHIPETRIGWSAKNVSITPKIRVKKDDSYAIVIKTEAATGCYGVAVTDLVRIKGVVMGISTDNGRTFNPDDDRILKLQTFY